MTLNKSSEYKPLGTITLTKTVGITADTIESVMVTALEGGIGYWAMLDKTTAGWADKPKEEPSSTWATKLLLEGKSITLIEADEDGEFEDSDDGADEATKHELTLEKLITGLQLNAKERPHDWDIEVGDVITADCIVQYAVFGDITFS